MADAATWSKRIAEWRSSGLTAQEFCKTGGFSAAGLYAWSSRLGRSSETRTSTGVRIARVVTATTPAQGRGRQVGAEVSRARHSATADEATALVVELGEARIIVGVGVQRDTLELVLDALVARVRRGAA